MMHTITHNKNNYTSFITIDNKSHHYKNMQFITIIMINTDIALHYTTGNLNEISWCSIPAFYEEMFTDFLKLRHIKVLKHPNVQTVFEDRQEVASKTPNKIKFSQEPTSLYVEMGDA